MRKSYLRMKKKDLQKHKRKKCQKECQLSMSHLNTSNKKKLYTLPFSFHFFCFLNTFFCYLFSFFSINLIEFIYFYYFLCFVLIFFRNVKLLHTTPHLDLLKIVLFLQKVQKHQKALKKIQKTLQKKTNHLIQIQIQLQKKKFQKLKIEYQWYVVLFLLSFTFMK